MVSSVTLLLAAAVTMTRVGVGAFTRPQYHQGHHSRIPERNCAWGLPTSLLVARSVVPSDPAWTNSSSDTTWEIPSLWTPANQQPQQQDRLVSVDEAESRHGMPWKTSIDPDKKDELLYMHFWEWQMSFMKANFRNLRVEPCHNHKFDFSYCENSEKKARIANLVLSSDEYRKIRLSYFDVGDKTQVFNCVLYPRPEFNLPILGVDFLAFHGKKIVTIMDFQPIHESMDDHAIPYEHLLEAIKAPYQSLHGQMSSRFYDEKQFFSPQMLFARTEERDFLFDELFPAFQSYVALHWDLIRRIPPDFDGAPYVLERQKAYDCYSAEHDPAAGLFASIYGKDWTEGFIHDFLFSFSARTNGGFEFPHRPYNTPPESSGTLTP